MNRRTSRFFILQVLLLAALAFVPRSAAHAGAGDLALSNVAETTYDVSDVLYGDWSANAFTTNNQRWLLNSVIVSMAPASNTDGNFFLSIFDTAVGGGPGSELGLLDGVDNPSGTPSSLFEYTAAGAGLLLNANTQYWVVAGVSSGNGIYNWNYTESSSTTGPWSIPLTFTYIRSLDQGASWTLQENGYPQQFEINATAIPVPEIDPAGIGSVLALVTGAIGLLERRRLKAA